LWQVFLPVALVFGALAGAMAFLVTYEEYSHHHLPRAQLLQQSFHMAGATLVFFLLLMLIILAATGVLSVPLRPP
jgi:hypothetical protein